MNSYEFQEYKKTISDAKDSRRFIKENGLRKYYFYTGGLSILVFIGLFILAHLISDTIINFFWYDLFNIPKAEVLNTSRFIISFILAIPIRIFFFYFHNTIVQFLGFPLFLRLAYKTASILDVKKGKLKFGDAFARMFLIQIPIMFRYIFWMFAFYILMYVPFMRWHFSYRGFMTSSYFTGFAIADYYNELNGIPYKESKKWIKSHEGYASAVGSIGSVLLMIPVLGIVFSPVISTVSAGLAYQRTLKRDGGFVSDKKQIELIRRGFRLNEA